MALCETGRKHCLSTWVLSLSCADRQETHCLSLIMKQCACWARECEVPMWEYEEREKERGMRLSWLLTKPSLLCHSPPLGELERRGQ